MAPSRGPAGRKRKPPREIEIPTDTRNIRRVRSTKTDNTRRQAECQNDSSPDNQPARRNPFLDLPKELLIDIVGHVLIVDPKITLRDPREARWAREIANLRDIPPRSRQLRFPPGYQHAPMPKRKRKSPALPVLLVCKDFYYAGLEAYYGKNQFQFEGVAHLQQIKERMHHKALLERIRIELMWTRITGADTDPPRFDTKPNLSNTGDVLRELIALKRVLVICMAEETIGLAAASRAAKVKRQIMDVVERAWRSGVERKILEFVFPEDWGKVITM